MLFRSTKKYEAFGIAPDGRLFLGGWEQITNGNSQPILVYSADDGQAWKAGARDQYCWGWQGPNFAFLEKSGGYDVICGTLVSEDKGANWSMVPRIGNVWVHPGPIGWDPNRSKTFYVKTDQGVAVTTDGGYGFSKAWTRPQNTNVERIAVIDMGNKIGRAHV